MILPMLYADFYKADHRRQYPEGTRVVYSNLTPRGSRVDGINHVVVFGIQYFVKEYLYRRFSEGFFWQPKEAVLRQYKRRLDNALGKDVVPSVEHVAALHDLGFLPIEVKALPEGTCCPMRVPCLTIRNTRPEFFWLTNFLETILCNVLWGPMTSATTAFEYRRVLDQYAGWTSDMPEFVPWQGHDFSMRGHFGLEAALLSGAAHLLSFTGTDTIPAIDFLEEFYGADSDRELIGGSVPATEHSVMSFGGQAGELATFRRLLQLYPSGVVSVVSDTWDYWRVVTKVLPLLRAEVMGRDGKLVIRPDSGNPVNILCGDLFAPEGSPERKGTIEALWDVFGGTINSKGFRQFDPHIGVIYGDSITLDRCQSICARLMDRRFASTNVVLGIGSYTYQYVTRDTFGFAMKATYGDVGGQPVSIYKDPKTDSGIKKSARGLLRVNADLTLSENVSPEEERGGLLETVFVDGVLVREQSLADIRGRLERRLMAKGRT